GVDLTFARCGFRELGVAGSAAERALLAPAERAFELLRPHLAAAPCWALDAFVPDTDLDNPLVEGVAAIGRERHPRVAPRAPGVAPRRVELAALRLRDGIVAAVCLATSGLYVGSVGATEALGLASGGRSRVRVPGDKPSRAARKLEEAFAWFGVGPAPGELCVDLGAAPGGWSWLLLERGARVVAVDPARMRPDLTARRALRHVQDSAFRYEHERDDPFGTGEPADWLCCDMAWRPLEVAALLAKWGRRGGARLLVANLKLPMKRKAEMVARLRGIVAEGGWRDVRTRQLYHDREEVTLVAHR
ncbi:MAG: 23S rRNA (cytidine(2498)-2'-O)-methyltransferase RlmM, partial [Myxococcales bacterium]|nr:23S rRNA (cytidine(2498)-2'-O)-methyltransferase RlmM [Myxococcales bacterium]